MTERDQAAVGFGADPEALAGRRAVADGGECVLALEDDLYRATDLAGGDGGDEAVRPEKKLAAEPAPDEGRPNRDPAGRDPQDLCQRLALAHDPLGSNP